MTNTEGHEDEFSFWGTEVLISIAFSVTPQHELGDWVVTSPERFTEDGTAERYTEDQLRAFAVEQLEDYGITIHDVNRMKS